MVLEVFVHLASSRDSCITCYKHVLPHCDTDGLHLHGVLYSILWGKGNHRDLRGVLAFPCFYGAAWNGCEISLEVIIDIIAPPNTYAAVPGRSTASAKALLAAADDAWAQLGEREEGGRGTCVGDCLL